MIVFDDPDHEPLFFEGPGAEEAARANHKRLCDMWTCELFLSAADIKTPLTGMLRVFEREIIDLNNELWSWRTELNLWRSAWLRHLGGYIVRKHHEIDGFGLRHEQQLKEEYERGVGEAKHAMVYRDRFIEEVARGLCVPPDK